MSFRLTRSRALLFVLALSSLFSLLALTMGVGGSSTASFFQEPDTGLHVDSQGNVWYDPSFNYEAANNGQAKVLTDANLGRTMVLTRMLHANPRATTCISACGQLTGANGQPMRCVDNVSSFPRLNGQGGKLFYPHAAVRESSFPGHGAHGGNFDSICLGSSRVGDEFPASTCSHTFGLDTISTCSQCAKNIDPGESIGPGSNFADGVVVACAEGIVAQDQDGLHGSADDAGRPNTDNSSGPQIVQNDPLYQSLQYGEDFVVEVSGSETGVSECAKYNKVCSGGYYAARNLCKEFYPEAEEANAAEGYPHDFFCQGGSTQQGEPCEGVLADTCMVAVSSDDQYRCEDPVKAGVDSVFVRCEDPFVPETIEQQGTFQEPVSDPVFDADSGTVEYDVTIRHPDDLATKLQVLYGSSADAEGDFQAATLLSVEGSTQGSAEVSDGAASLNSSLEYQIGEEDRIDTNEFEEVQVRFVWDAYTDLGLNPQGEYQFIVRVEDSQGNVSWDFTPVFEFADTGSSADSAQDTANTSDDSQEEGDTHGSASNPADIDADGTANVFDEDVDGDGIVNDVDRDDDADQILDEQDESPQGVGSLDDIDGDGIPNAQDSDMDGDGINNSEDPDRDGDGIPDVQDTDVDNDGISNDQDDDIDGDGIPNEEDADMDGDGVPNSRDSRDRGAQEADESLVLGAGEDFDELLEGTPQNCFEGGCTPEERQRFLQQYFDEQLSQIGSGSAVSFTESESRSLEFLQELVDKGYAVNELSEDELPRDLAVSIALEVLMLRGNIDASDFDRQNSAPFPDVSLDSKSGKAIALAQELEIVSGYPTGEFVPDRAVSTVEAAKMMVKTASLVSQRYVGSQLDYQSSLEASQWYIPYLRTLVGVGISLLEDDYAGFEDYDSLGASLDVFRYLQLFQALSDILGIEDVFAQGAATSA